MTTKKPSPRGSYENRGELTDLMIPVKINEYLMASALETAFEGGSTYWCPAIRFFAFGATEDKDDRYGKLPTWRNTSVTERDSDEGYLGYLCRNVALGGNLTVFELDEVENTCIPHLLTKEKLVEGFRRFFTDGRARLEAEEDGSVGFDCDADDADVILQYAIFDEIRYG